MQNSFTQKFSTTNKVVPYIIVISLLLFSLLIGISIGSVSIPISNIIMVIIGKVVYAPLLDHVEPMLINIIWNIRLPRVLLAMFVGSSLALAGAAFQGFLKNPLADPYTLGVSSGAALGAVIVLFFGITIPFLGKMTLPIFSILLGFLTLLLVISFAKLINRHMAVETIILTGIIFSSFLGSLISLMIALTGEELRQIIGWLMGSVSMRGWEYVKLQIPFFILGTLMLLFNCRELNALSFGEETAKHLGVNIQTRKLLILLGAALLTGSAVAVSGTIGFVGLVIPHLVRLLWGADHKHLLPLATICGGAFLILADLLARTVISPTEIPIGVITALIGGPVFGIILFKARRV
ncbi:FecCD family ABC transporter permease [Anaerobacillus isosaccharinicus]|uniref:ABC transporter permease n=1 Tax=Anaerobacillus isosaccharinicus TaxID=1532552 RepID=A0A1S2M4H7_9BACI|nr:iron ABC transporter permease [Anaerobacillus isosaccharinicus]MBA5585785.1 iron ABC transporter permease [Anaerobacillus isosaccharinicus]QOY35916.1 iron ABC transporter permease [Anaerobacillus isosaccharinicus]